MTNLIKKHAKSFYWAGFFLSKETFYKCSSLYNFCRTLDDLADDNNTLDIKKENFSKFKENLSQVLIDKIIPISNEIKKLLNEKKYIEEILSEGCKNADDIASKKLKKIHEIIGF